MPTCGWCQCQIKSSEEHINFFGAYTCPFRNPIQTPAPTVAARSPLSLPNMTIPMDIDKDTEGDALFEASYKRKGITLVKLYHQTSPASAQKIIEEGIFRPGWYGIAGPAIYFATKPEDTYHKARCSGVILECWVDLGLVLTLSENGDVTLNKEIVYARGYNTVLIPRQRGYEYAIYDSDRIKRIKKISEFTHS